MKLKLINLLFLFILITLTSKAFAFVDLYQLQHTYTKNDNYFSASILTSSSSTRSSNGARDTHGHLGKFATYSDIVAQKNLTVDFVLNQIDIVTEEQTDKHKELKEANLALKKKIEKLEKNQKQLENLVIMLVEKIEKQEK